MQLGQINLLDALASADLLRTFKRRQIERKTIIFTPFEQSNSVFIIKSGRLRVFLSYDDKEFTLAFLEAGDVFSTHTRAYVQAVEETEILLTPTSAFQATIESLPGVSLVMAKVLGDLLKNSITTIEGLAFKDVRRRIADFLVQTFEERGEESPAGVVVKLGLSTEDIALLIGTTRQTISLILNDLIKEEIIEKPNRRTLIVRDLAALLAWRDSL
ncbi:MAG: Crp/Fnr family transcriptional regulator [Desulfuromonas sp.]|nr:MAG: Crp/Fnr family transcriptional regulator [Desulfuromonas sp.]